MTFGDALARLTAGLARDEAVAQAATGTADRGDPAQWRTGPERTGSTYVEKGGIQCGPDEYFTTPYFDGADTIVYDEGTPSVAEAAHIALHDPARVLGQAEAIRKVIADCKDPSGAAFGDYASAAIDYDSFRAGVEAATALFVAALAGIYAEEQR